MKSTIIVFAAVMATSSAQLSKLPRRLRTTSVESTQSAEWGRDLINENKVSSKAGSNAQRRQHRQQRVLEDASLSMSMSMIELVDDAPLYIEISMSLPSTPIIDEPVIDVLPEAPEEPTISVLTEVPKEDVVEGEAKEAFLKNSSSVKQFSGAAALVAASFFLW
jgi:hypothetical protein